MPICLVFGIRQGGCAFHVLTLAPCAARGSNNRLDERNRNRENNNRLFDSQNNNKGGYNQNDMVYYVGSLLDVEWTNQHGCSGNCNCQVWGGLATLAGESETSLRGFVFVPCRLRLAFSTLPCWIGLSCFLLTPRADYLAVPVRGWFLWYRSSRRSAAHFHRSRQAQQLRSGKAGSVINFACVHMLVHLSPIGTP